MSILFFSRFPYYHVFQTISIIALERMCNELAIQVKNIYLLLLLLSFYL